MQFKNIVVATDLSRASSTAYPFAAALAKVFDAHITLLHVDDASGFTMQRSQVVADYLMRISRYHRDELHRAREWFRSRGFSVDVATREGRPAQQILEFAAERAADLIVLTKRGARGPERLLLGSTCKRLVRKSNLPVLVVEPDATADEAQDTITYQRLLTTTDYSADSARGLKATLRLADKLQARIKLVHVVRVPATSGLPTEVNSLYSDSVRAAFCEEPTERLRGVVPAGETARMESQVLCGPAVGEAIARASETDTDLIVIPTHGKGTVKVAFFGSTADSVLRRSTKPVLVLPREYLETAASSNAACSTD